jgi:hypothetical protein
VTGSNLSWPGSSSVTQEYFDNCKGLIQNTLGLIVDSVRRNYPKHHLTITTPVDFIGLAASRDDISCTPSKENPLSAILRLYQPPARRFGGEDSGQFSSAVDFGCYDYSFNGTDFILYIVTGQDGIYSSRYSYILTPVEDVSPAALACAQKKADGLLAAGVNWQEALHNEVLVFDQGMWQKNQDLYKNIQKANWEDVILEKEKKETIINDVLGFFKSSERYAEFGIPWKVRYP